MITFTRFWKHPAAQRVNIKRKSGVIPTGVQWAHNWSSSLSNVLSRSSIAERENTNTGPSIRQEHARSTLAAPILAMRAPARAPAERERRRLRLRCLGHKGCIVRLPGAASKQGSHNLYKFVFSPLD